MIAKAITSRSLYVLVALGVVLRIAAELSNPVRIGIIALGAVSLVVSSRRGALQDKALIFLSVLVGLGPLLGWVHGASRLVDPLVVAAIIAILFTLNDIIHRDVTLHMELAAPAALGIATLGFWWPYAHASSTVLQLSRLMWGWDHFGHYYLMMSTARYGGFIYNLPTPSVGGTWYDTKYPSGIHMAWTQWWRVSPTTVVSEPLHYINTYSIAVIVTLAVTCVLITLAVMRIASSPRLKFLAAIVTGGFLVGYLVFGALAMTVWKGFPNFGIAMAGTCIAISFATKPLASRYINIVVITSGLAIAAYNWYPVAIPASGICAYVLLGYIGSTRGRQRFVTIASITLSAVVLAAPVLLTLSFGAKHLEVPGGIDRVPINLVIFIIFVGAAIGTWILSRGITVKKIALLSPLFLAHTFQISIMLIIRYTTGEYPYYVQKMAYVTTVITLVTLLMLAIQYVEPRMESSVKAKTSKVQYAAQVLSVLLFAIAATQAFSYSGPDSTALEGKYRSALGIQNRYKIIKNEARMEHVSKVLLSLSKVSQGMPLKELTCLKFVDMKRLDYDAVLLSYYTGVVTWSLTEEHLAESQELRSLWFYYPKGYDEVSYLNRQLNPKRDCPLVSSNLVAPLEQRNSAWIGRLWGVDPDGTVHPPRKNA